MGTCRNNHTPKGLTITNRLLVKKEREGENSNEMCIYAIWWRGGPKIWDWLVGCIRTWFIGSPLSDTLDKLIFVLKVHRGVS